MDVSIIFILVIFYGAICCGIYIKMETISLLSPIKRIAFLVPVLSLAIYMRLLTKKDVGKWRLTVCFLNIREFMTCVLYALSQSVGELASEPVRKGHKLYRSTAKYNASLKQVNAVKRAGAPKGKALYQLVRKAGEEMEKRFA